MAMVGDEFSDCTGMTTDNEPTDQFADQSVSAHILARTSKERSTELETEVRWENYNEILEGMIKLYSCHPILACILVRSAISARHAYENVRFAKAEQIELSE